MPIIWRKELTKKPPNRPVENTDELFHKLKVNSEEDKQELDNEHLFPNMDDVYTPDDPYE